MADLYGTAPDSEEISNILSQLIHGHGSSASSCMPFKPTYMQSSVPPPIQAATPSEVLIPEARYEDHRRFAQLVNRSGTDQRVAGGNSNSAGVLASSSAFDFYDSGRYFTEEVKEGMEADGRRISSENDLGGYSCDSEGLEEAADAQLNSALPRSSSKRSRAAEVHNMSEKRRRSRINEKMKALQNLIPNSNKTDKASMLDEVIEYLKQLQLQVQMLTMRNGLRLHPMCLPGVMQPMQLPRIFEEGSNKFPKSGEGINPFYGTHENSVLSAFNLSAGCMISNPPMVIPSVANVATSEATFGFEPSIQAHYRPYSVPSSSKELVSDSEPQTKLDTIRTGKSTSSDVDV